MGKEDPCWLLTYLFYYGSYKSSNPEMQQLLKPTTAWRKKKNLYPRRAPSRHHSFPSMFPTPLFMLLPPSFSKQAIMLVAN